MKNYIIMTLLSTKSGRPKTGEMSVGKMNKSFKPLNSNNSEFLFVFLLSNKTEDNFEKLSYSILKSYLILF